MDLGHSLFFCIAVAAVLALGGEGSAASLPFKASGTGQIAGDPTAGGAPFSASGTGTHLGSWTNAGTLVVVPTSATSGVAVGTVTFTASDGAQLHATFQGTLNLVTGAGKATFTWTGGTERFNKATGSAPFDVQNQPSGAFTLEVDGSIHF